MYNEYDSLDSQHKITPDELMTSTVFENSICRPKELPHLLSYCDNAFLVVNK